MYFVVIEDKYIFCYMTNTTNK